VWGVLKKFLLHLHCAFSFLKSTKGFILTSKDRGILRTRHPLWSTCGSILTFLYNVLKIIVCPFVPMLLVIILSVIILSVIIRFTASGDHDFVSSNISLTRQYISVRKHNSYYLRRTDNTMAKRKGTKGQITIYKTLHRKLEIEQHEPY